MRNTLPGLVAMLALLLAGCESGAPGVCKVAHVTDLPIAFRRGHLVVPVTLNGVATSMMLDTGSQGTTVTKAAAERLGLSLQFTEGRMYGVGGSRSLYLFYARSFKLGALHGEDLPLTAAAVDFSEYDPPLDGLIGSDFLSNYDIDLDLLERKAKLFKVISGCNTPSAVMQEPLFQAALVSGGPPGDKSPFVRVQIDGKTLLAEIDSGAQGTVIFRNAARRLGLRLGELKDDRHFRSSGVGPRERDTVRHVMTPITVGEITISNLPVGLVDETLSDGTDMLLGLDFLARVHTWISFSSGTLVMQYPPTSSPKLAD